MRAQDTIQITGEDQRPKRCAVSLPVAVAHTRVSVGETVAAQSFCSSFARHLLAISSILLATCWPLEFRLLHMHSHRCTLVPSLTWPLIALHVVLS